MQTKQSSASALRSATAWRPLQRVMMPALRALVSVVMLGAGAAQAATFEGTSPSRNSGPYRIPATGTGAVSGAPAESYPLEVNVPESVAQGQVVRGVKVQLNSLIHTWATDLDIMLVAPNGQNVLLLSDAGSSGDLSGNYTFEDAAASTVPVGATIPAGSYKPTNVGAGDNFPFPAPAPSPAVTLSSLNGVAAAGTWRLFIVDDEDVISGSIGSFKLTLQTGFPNGSAITINDAASANPYPSTINVSGLTGTISKVTARVNGLTHTNPTDIDMLLVSPSGQGVRLMSDNGGGDDVAGVNLSFDDAAANSLGVVQIVSGTYKPSNNGANDAFAAPAPTAPYGTTLAAFNGTNPNGEWKLFIVDDSALDTGSLASWSIDIETTPPVISLAPTASVTEGGILSTTITRSVGNGVSTVRVAADDASGTTTALGFFDFSGGPEVTMTFADGEVSKTFNVTTLNDTIDEADEEFRVTIFNPTQATIGNDKTVATIVDNDAPPVLSLQGPTVSESGNLSFAYTLSGPSGLPISFNASTSNGTAVAGSDYTALANAPVTIPVGTTSGTITVPVVNDTQDEANETLTLTLSNPVNVSLPAAPAAVGTILDDDASPDISIGDVTITEGNSGTANASFTILISSPSGQAVSVDYATADGTAASGSDYTSTSGTVVIAPGQTQRTITVPVAGDVEIEGNEAFTVNLSNAVNGNIADGQGVGTITNDDTAQSLPVISINDASVTEGNSATSTNSAVFTVSLSAPSPQPVTFSFATSAGTAALSSDFPNLSGPITIAAGVTSQSIVVPVFGDTVVEANETFFVTLSNVNNATPGDVTGTGTIVNDDAATPAPQVLAVTPGSALRNADVVIVGLNFAGATSVKFNGVAATFIVTSPNRITAKVPATATTGALTITTPAGTTARGPSPSSSRRP
jgi:subtilisin-like proprotein convertase family protein